MPHKIDFHTGWDDQSGVDQGGTPQSVSRTDIQNPIPVVATITASIATSSIATIDSSFVDLTNGGCRGGGFLFLFVPPPPWLIQVGGETGGTPSMQGSYVRMDLPRVVVVVVEGDDWCC